MAGSKFTVGGDVVLTAKNVRAVAEQIQKGLSSVKGNIDIDVSKTTVTNVGTLSKNLDALTGSLTTVTPAAESAAAAIARLQSAINGFQQGTTKVKVAVSGVNHQLAAMSKATVTGSSELFRFGEQAALAARRFAAFAAPVSIMFSLGAAIRSGAKQYLEFQHVNVRIGQVTGKTTKQLADLNSTIFDLATTLGASSLGLQQTAQTLAQAGLTAKDTKIALEALAKTELAPTFDDINKTTETAIAIFGQFKTSAKDLEAQLGSINAVSARYAVESADLATAIRGSGGAFQSAGGDLNELLALFTSVRSKTRESAETISTAFRTIFARLQRPKTQQTIEELLGINLSENGQFIGPLRAIEKLNLALSDLPDGSLLKARVAEEVGGIRQISKVIPLINEYQTAMEALGVAQGGSASLTEDVARANESMTIQLQKVQANFAKLFQTIGESDSFQSLFKFVVASTNALIRLTEALVPLLPILTTFATITTFKAIGPFAKGFASKITNTKTGIGSAGPLGFATGGLVPGSGSGDKIKAMLTPGEIVINKKSVNEIGAGRLLRLNRLGGKAVDSIGDFQFFADGGLVGRGGLQGGKSVDEYLIRKLNEIQARENALDNVTQRALSGSDTGGQPIQLPAGVPQGTRLSKAERTAAIIKVAAEVDQIKISPAVRAKVVTQLNESVNTVELTPKQQKRADRKARRNATRATQPADLEAIKADKQAERARLDVLRGRSDSTSSTTKGFNSLSSIASGGGGNLDSISSVITGNTSSASLATGVFANFGGVTDTSSIDGPRTLKGKSRAVGRPKSVRETKGTVLSQAIDSTEFGVSKRRFRKPLVGESPIGPVEPTSLTLAGAANLNNIRRKKADKSRPPVRGIPISPIRGVRPSGLLTIDAATRSKVNKEKRDDKTIAALDANEARKNSASPKPRKRPKPPKKSLFLPGTTILQSPALDDEVADFMSGRSSMIRGGGKMKTPLPFFDDEVDNFLSGKKKTIKGRGGVKIPRPDINTQVADFLAGQGSSITGKGSGSIKIPKTNFDDDVANFLLGNSKNIPGRGSVKIPRRLKARPANTRGPIRPSFEDDVNDFLSGRDDNIIGRGTLKIPKPIVPSIPQVDPKTASRRAKFPNRQESREDREANIRFFNKGSLLDRIREPPLQLPEFIRPEKEGNFPTFRRFGRNLKDRFSGGGGGDPPNDPPGGGPPTGIRGRLSRLGQKAPANFGKVALGAAALGFTGAADDFIGDIAAGTASNSVEGAERRKRTVDGLQGVLAGASTGAIVGGTVGGPLGAVVGGVVGGASGLVTALRQAEKDILDTKVDEGFAKATKASEELTTALAASKGRLNDLVVGAATRGFQAQIQQRQTIFSAAGSNQTDTLDSFSDNIGAIFSGLSSLTSGKGFVSGFDKNIDTKLKENVAESDQRELSLISDNTGNRSNLRATLLKESRQQGDFAKSNLGRSVIEEEARQRSLLKFRQADLEGNSLNTAQRGQVGIELLAVVEKEIAVLEAETIAREFNQKAVADFTSTITAQTTALEKINASFADLASANAVVDNFRDTIFGLSGTSPTKQGNTTISDNIGRFGSAGFEKAADSLFRSGGITREGGNTLIDANRATEVLKKDLPGILSGVDLRSEDGPEALRSKVVDALKGAGVGESTVKGISDQIERLQDNPDTLQSFGGVGGSDALQKELLGSFKDLQDAAESSAKALEAGASRLSGSFADLFQKSNEVGVGLDNARKLQANVAEIQASQKAKQFGGDATSFLGVPGRQAAFLGQQQRLTGLQGAAAVDPKAILKRFNESNKKALEAKAIADANPADEGAIKNFRQFENDTQNAAQALRNLTDASNLNAAVQERLATLDRDSDARLSFGEKFELASDKEQREMAKKIDAFNKAVANGGLNGLGGKQRRQAIEGGRLLGDTRVFGGERTANQFVDQFVQAPNNRNGLFGQNRRDGREAANLRDQQVQNAQGAVNAQGALNNIGQNQLNIGAAGLGANLNQQGDNRGRELLQRINPEVFANGQDPPNVPILLPPGQNNGAVFNDAPPLNAQFLPGQQPALPQGIQGQVVKPNLLDFREQRKASFELGKLERRQASGQVVDQNEMQLLRSKAQGVPGAGIVQQLEGANGVGGAPGVANPAVAIDEFNLSLKSFQQSAPALVEALNKMPRSIQMTGQFTHEVIINGAETLNQLVPALKEMVASQISAKLRSVFPDNPDAQRA